jgi:hypothetical protein
VVTGRTMNALEYLAPCVISFVNCVQLTKFVLPLVLYVLITSWFKGECKFLH